MTCMCIDVSAKVFIVLDSWSYYSKEKNGSFSLAFFENQTSGGSQGEDADRTAERRPATGPTGPQPMPCGPEKRIKRRGRRKAYQSCRSTASRQRRKATANNARTEIYLHPPPSASLLRRRREIGGRERRKALICPSPPIASARRAWLLRGCGFGGEGRWGEVRVPCGRV